MEASETLGPKAPEGERQSAGSRINKTETFDRLRRAAQAEPKSERAWLDLANETDDTDEAIQALTQVVALNPANIEARNRLSSLQINNLRDGILANERSYRETFFRRFAPLLPILIGLVALIAIVYLAKDPVIKWLNDRALAASAQKGVPTLGALVLPPTWTPVPTSTPSRTPVPSPTPVSTATPAIVTGRINGTVRVRSGPGPMFPIIGTLNEPQPVVLVGQSADGSYYQVHQPDDTALVWVSADFVTLTGGDPSTLPVVTVPTPTVPPTPKPVYRPPPPTPVPVLLYIRSKYVPNPHGLRCDRTFIQGSVWQDYHKECSTCGIPGILVRVWVNGQVYFTDTSGSHGAANRNNGYWEVNFPLMQAVSGQVAVVSPDGQMLSQQYDFALAGGDCSNPNSVNEIIIDFSH